MTRGCEVSKPVRMIVVRMAASKVATKLISYYTDIPLRTIQNIIHTFRTTGSLGMTEREGRPGKLNAEIMEVYSSRYCHYWILNNHQDLIAHVTAYPDRQLRDYQRYLGEHGVHVSISTIWRALHRAGMSQKTVRHLH